MRSLLYFSGYFKVFAQKLRFASTVISRWVRILFRWRRGIECLYLNYSKEHLFSNSFLVINFHFKNILWYKFRNIKSTTTETPLVLNLKKLKEFEILLTVYGFFRKKRYLIKFDPGYLLDVTRYSPDIKIFQKIPKEFMPQLALQKKKPKVVPKDIELKTRTIKLNPSSYTKTDFL